MTWLLRLYPRAWRARYGDEFLALLEESGVSTRDLVNILRSVALAWLCPPSNGVAPATRGSGLAFMLAALIWFTVPPVLLNFGVFRPMTAMFTALMHTGAVLLTLVVLGCRGYRRRSAPAGWAAMTRVGYWVVVGAWLLYVTLDALVSIGMVSLWGRLLSFGVFGILLCDFPCLFLGLGSMALGAMWDDRRPRLGTLPFVIVLPLGLVCLAMFVTHNGGNVAPAWSVEVYMALYVTIGVGWFPLGLTLVRGSRRRIIEYARRYS